MRRSHLTQATAHGARVFDPRLKSHACGMFLAHAAPPATCLCHGFGAPEHIFPRYTASTQWRKTGTVPPRPAPTETPLHLHSHKHRAKEASAQTASQQDAAAHLEVRCRSYPIRRVPSTSAPRILVTPRVTSSSSVPQFVLEGSPELVFLSGPQRTTNHSPREPTRRAS